MEICRSRVCSRNCYGRYLSTDRLAVDLSTRVDPDCDSAGGSSLSLDPRSGKPNSESLTRQARSYAMMVPPGSKSMIDVLVIGGGPAGVVAALRAADAGAKTTLVTRDEFGGMAANDGPVPVREVVQEVQEHSTFRTQIDSLGVIVHENAGSARFVDAHTIETASGLRLNSAKTIICTGGISRQLTVPGSEFTATHSDAWRLTCIPESILVLGGGATGVQVASVFNVFGSKIQLFQAGPRILPAEDEEVSAAVANAFRNSGVLVRENFGAIESFEKTPAGVRMWFSKDGRREPVEASWWYARSVGQQIRRTWALRVRESRLMNETLFELMSFSERPRRISSPPATLPGS